MYNYREPNGSIIGCWALHAKIMDSIAEAAEKRKPDVARKFWSISEHLDEASVLFEEALKELIGKKDAEPILHPKEI